MNMTFDDEYTKLLDLIKYKEYRRYGKDLYAKYIFDGGYEWKYEYNICEFVWGFVKNPCFAPGLVRYLEKNVIDMRKYLKILAKSNKRVDSSRLYHKWESAMNVAESCDKPCIIYSTENSHLMMSGKIFCNDVDGELLHGLLMTKSFVANLDYINIELAGTNQEGRQWRMDYRFHQSEVNKDSHYFEGDQPDLIFYAPFKHPLILMGSNLECVVSFNFIKNDDCVTTHNAFENQVKIVYGVCGGDMKKLIDQPTNTFTCELCRGHSLIIDTSNGYVDELSGNAN